MKKLARKQTSNRKTAIGETKTIYKRRRGGVKSKHRKEGTGSYTVSGYSGNKCKAMLGRTTFREIRLLRNPCAHRKREQLSNLGKLNVNPKVKQDSMAVRERWGELIPHDVEFSVAGLLGAMCCGKVKPNALVLVGG